MLSTDTLLDFYIEWERELLRKERSTNNWYASGLGYCLRRQWMQRMAVPELQTIEAKTRRIFKAGDMFHTYLKNVYWRLGLMVQDEVRLEDTDLHVSGYIDAVVRTHPTLEVVVPDGATWSEDWVAMLQTMRQRLDVHVNAADKVTKELDGGTHPHNIGLEFKSQNSRAIARAYDEGPQEHHMLQLATYKLLADRRPEQLPEPIEEWRLVYVGKDSLGLLTFGLTSEYVDKVAERIATLNEAWDTESPPECECAGWMVPYCPYFTCTCGKERHSVSCKAQGCCSLDLLATIPEEVPA